MKIKIALIPGELVSKAQDLSAKLQGAMETGEMSVVDQLTDELISLTDQGHSLSLTEKYWRQMIEKVRNFNDAFKSDYIMTKPQLEMIRSSGVAESFADVANIVEQALNTDGVVLQLPFEDDGDTDV